MWDLITAHYGCCDRELLALVAAASGIADPNVIYTGQVLMLPALDSSPAQPDAQPAAPSVAAGEATWALHTIVAGDTLWDILEGHYGFVSADLVWSIAAYNGLEDPSDIPIGTVITLPPLDAAGVPLPAPAASVPTPPDAGPDRAGGGRRRRLIRLPRRLPNRRVHQRRRRLSRHRRRSGRRRRR